jgi:hypothetical protein
MQQRQLRLGDILDDYCPRERRLTNHAVVAMVGSEVKQTRCTTCDAEHEYKHAKVPRQRRKAETPAVLYTQVLAGGPKHVAHEPPQTQGVQGSAGGTETADIPQVPGIGAIAKDGRPVVNSEPAEAPAAPVAAAPPDAASATSDATPAAPDAAGDESEQDDAELEEGPVHRPLIRATLPRPDGQPPPARPAPDFTVRQPAGRPFRLRARHQRGGPPFAGRTGSMAGGPMRGGAPRQGNRPPLGSRLAKRQGPGRKRSK